MCSRYYIDPNMMEEISRVVQNIDGRIRLTQGDIRPTDVAPVIGQSDMDWNWYVQMGISSRRIYAIWGELQFIEGDDYQIRKNTSFYIK
mgnify:CR=1 FL=1